MVIIASQIYMCIVDINRISVVSPWGKWSVCTFGISNEMVPDKIIAKSFLLKNEINA